MTPVAVGRAAIEAAGEKVRADRAGVEEVGWVAWSVGRAWSVSGRDELRLTFKDRSAGLGVRLLATGVLPMAAVRRDGWSLSASGTPVTLHASEFPAWLLTAFGGQWVKVSK